MRNMILKIFGLGLLLFAVKAAAIAQNTDIKCELIGLDFNLSEDYPDYLVKLGSLSMFENDGHGVITKYYKLPRTKLTLSVSVVHYPKDEHEPTPSDDILMMSMLLGKKKISHLSDFNNEKMAKDAVGLAQTVYPMEFFDKGGEGALSTAFFGKKRPIHISMKCKKTGK